MPTPVKITAELRQWVVDETQRTVIGIIHNSNVPEYYTDGSQYAILNYMNITHYKDNTYSEGYYVVRTQINNYFKLYESQRK